ncbi:hypothetical protein GGR55DRAFT_667350 [Xylaria sp. FL0064]|nr:hypothetical protein GGR55DRAFT_667350 [Xylaria sp. FL0064]
MANRVKNMMFCERKAYGQLRLPSYRPKLTNKVNHIKKAPTVLLCARPPSSPNPGQTLDTIVCAAPRNKINEVRSYPPVSAPPQLGQPQDLTPKDDHGSGHRALQAQQPSDLSPEPLAPPMIRAGEAKQLPIAARQSNKINIKMPQPPALLPHPPQELQGQASSPQRRRSQCVRTTTKILEDRCAYTDGCQTDSCVNRYMLVECDSKNCSLLWCDNRHFTWPPHRSLTVFDTPDGCGLHLRTDAALPAGAFVVEYTGRWCRWIPGSGLNHCMNLGGGWALDTQDMETQARYTNHACQSNCKTWKWVGADKERYIGIFTETNIAAGEELTIC